MSVEAMAWALSAPFGGSPKLVLIGLGNHAHADGRYAFPSIQRLAAYAHVDRRTVQRALRTLEADGYIAADGVGPSGQRSYSLSMANHKDVPIPGDEGGGILPPAAPVSPGGRHSGAQGGGASAAQTVHEPSTNHVVVRRAPADVVGALIHGGFDKGTIEQYNGAIVGALNDLQPADDTDWFRVGVLIEEAMRPGSPMRRRTPSAALKFVALGAGLPRVGEITRPKRTSKAAQNEAESDAFLDAFVDSMTWSDAA